MSDAERLRYQEAANVPLIKAINETLSKEKDLKKYSPILRKMAELYQGKLKAVLEASHEFAAACRELKGNLDKA